MLKALPSPRQLATTEASPGSRLMPRCAFEVSRLRARVALVEVVRPHGALGAAAGPIVRMDWQRTEVGQRQACSGWIGRLGNYID